jgi:predicted RecB family nuclease
MLVVAAIIFVVACFGLKWLAEYLGNHWETG